MDVLTAVHGTVTFVGLVVTVTATILILSGPFLAGPTLSQPVLLATLGGFLAGIIVMTWGLAKLAGVGSRV
jgi:hypothetical protein